MTYIIQHALPLKNFKILGANNEIHHIFGRTIPTKFF